MKIPKQLILFSIVGGVGFIADSAMLYAIKNHLGLYFSRLISFSFAVLITWYLNRTITFNKHKDDNIFSNFAKYYMAMLVGGTVNILSYYLTIRVIPIAYAHPIIAIAIGSIAGLLFNYLLSKRYIFKVNTNQ